MKPPWINQKSVRASTSSSDSSGRNSSLSPWDSPLRSSLLMVGSPLSVGARNLQSLPDFAVPSATGKMNSSFFCLINTSFALILRRSIFDASIFSKSLGLLSNIFFPNSQPRKIAGNTFLPNSWILAWSFGEDGWYSTIVPKSIILPFEWFSKSSFAWRFPICQEVLDISQTANFHPILTVATLLMCLLSLVGRHFQRCHLSRIDEVLKCGDSMIKTSHVFQNSIELSVKTTFGPCDGSNNLNKLLSVSCESLHFTLIRLDPLSGKILYHDSVPVIVSRFAPLIKDSLICVIKSPNFSARSEASPVRLLQEALVILVLKHTSQVRSFGKCV